MNFYFKEDFLQNNVIIATFKLSIYLGVNSNNFRNRFLVFLRRPLSKRCLHFVKVKGTCAEIR